MKLEKTYPGKVVSFLLISGQNFSYNETAVFEGRKHTPLEIFPSGQDYLLTISRRH